MAETNKTPQMPTVTTREFDPKSLLENGNCKFATDQGGDVTLNIKFARMIAITGKDITVSDTECLIFIRKCQTWKLDPFLGEIYFTKFRQSEPAASIVAADAFHRKVDAQPDYEGYDQGWIVDEAGKCRTCLEPKAALKPSQTIIGSWCQVYRKGRKTPVHQTLTREVMKVKQDGTPQATWGIMPQTMTVKCNVSQAHRKVYPGALGLMYSTDELSITPSEGRHETFEDAQVSAGSRIQDKLGQMEVLDAPVDEVEDVQPPKCQVSEKAETEPQEIPDCFNLED